MSHLEPNMRAIFEIVMSPCDVMYPKFWINGNCKKNWKFEEKKVTRSLENISHIFQNIAKIRDIFSKVGCKV